MKIYISSSWKNRKQVRQLAIELRKQNHDVYDFTDPTCRTTQEIPPEKFPELFNSSKHNYKEYISREEWIAAMQGNKEAILWADLIILLLPCGTDSHADWALGVGAGKKSYILGHPVNGDRSPVHLWANDIFENKEDLFKALS